MTPRRRVPSPVPTPPSGRTLDEDLALVRDLFGSGWRYYIFGTREAPGAVAWARQLGDAEKRQWGVFALFDAHRAVAYVTTPYTPDPADPGLIEWFFTGHIHTTATRLIATMGTPPGEDNTPMTLPESLRLPTTRPIIIGV